MVLPLGCYGVTCWLDRVPRFSRVILLCRFQGWYLFKFRRRVRTQSVVNSSPEAAEKPSIQTCSVNLFKVSTRSTFCTQATVCSESSVNNGPRWNAGVLQCAVLRQLLGGVWKIWTSFNSRLLACCWIGLSRIVGQYVSKSTYRKWKFVLKWWLL